MSTKFLTGIDGNSKEAVLFADPTAPGSLATKQYVDGIAQGIKDLKDPVRGTSTGNLAITALVNGLVHDGVTYATGDRILLKNQTDQTQNGIYVIGASGTGTRATDADDNAEITAGFSTTVLEGTTKGTGASQSNPITYIIQGMGPFTIGSSNLTFAPVGAGAVTLKSAGNGLTEDGSSYHVGQGNGILADPDAVKVDPAVVVRKASFDCAATTNPQTFTHSLNTKDITVQVRRKSDDVLVWADCVAATVDTVSVDFGGAPTSAQYRVTVHG